MNRDLMFHMTISGIICEGKINLDLNRPEHLTGMISKIRTRYRYFEPLIFLLFYSRRTNLYFGVQACTAASLILSPIPNDISLPSTYRIQIGGLNNNLIQVSYTSYFK